MLECLEGLSEAQSEAPKITNVVIDGAVLVQMLKPGVAETFEEYARKRSSSLTYQNNFDMCHI